MLTQQAAAGPRRAVGEGRSRLLRFALKLDAAASGLSAALLLAGVPLLEGPLGAPRAFLWPVGLFLGAYASAVWIVATRPRVSRPAARTVVAINLLWVIESVALVAAGWLPLTALGTVSVLAQAAAVALAADLQIVGLRRARPVGG
jgi:hypothetical protein